MKKMIALLLVVGLMMMGLVACTDSDSGDTGTEAPVAEAPADDADVAEEPDEAEAPDAGATDWSSFVLDPSQIPQEKLDTELHIAVSIRGLDNPYIVTKIEGMNMFSEWLDSIGQAHTTQVLDSGGSNDVEINNMRQFSALAGGNAIAYADPNESAIAPALAEAMAEGGGFMGTAWNKPDGVGPMDFTPNWVIHTSADNFTGGYETARLLFENMGGEGNVFVIEGMLGNTAAIDRRRGFDAALESFPGITVAHEDTGNWLTAEALTLTETWLNVTPDVGGIWCANDNMATGVLQALDNAGLLGEVGVTGIDATDDMVAAVRAGNAVATVSANGFLQSSYTLAIAYAAWTGLLDVEELPQGYREFFTPSVLVTTDNVEQFFADFVENAPSFDFTNIFYARASAME
ncbi:MAG: sugar ABC transporter substrate-binding protein [Lachnospiraceae bacterium]|nr:sugar ABC transporter substrate-binding protein [Lachnospiraceae bacterium]